MSAPVAKSSAHLFDSLIDAGKVNVQYSFEPQRVCLNFDAGFHSGVLCTPVSQSCDTQCAYEANKIKAFETYLGALREAVQFDSQSLVEEMQAMMLCD